MTATQPTPDLARACAQHTAYLRARLRGLGVAEANLDDAVQDVFEVLVRRLGDYDSRFSLRQWMAGVARRVARRHRERALRAPEPVDEAALASGGPDPERWTSRQEALAVLRSFLEQLDADRWAVFVLSEIEGLRGTEIAAELDVNLSTVYARLRTARQAFEHTLSQHRRRERRSWFVLPFFGLPSLTRRAGAMAFATPVLLVTLGTMGLGGVLAARSCGESAPAPAAVASAARAPTTAAPASGVLPREVDPPTIAGASRAAASEGPATAERDGWIAAGYGFHEGGPNFYDEPRFRLEGSDMQGRAPCPRARSRASTSRGKPTTATPRCSCVGTSRASSPQSGDRREPRGRHRSAPARARRRFTSHRLPVAAAVGHPSTSPVPMPLGQGTRRTHTRIRRGTASAVGHERGATAGARPELSCGFDVFFINA